jgi:hypothetical protein
MGDILFIKYRFSELFKYRLLLKLITVMINLLINNFIFKLLKYLIGRFSFILVFSFDFLIKISKEISGEYI